MSTDIINEEDRGNVEDAITAVELSAHGVEPAPAPVDAAQVAEDAADAAETLPAVEPAPIEVAPAVTGLGPNGEARPLSISVKLDEDPSTFTITVKRGLGPKADVIETFTGLKADDFDKRIDDPATGSKFIVLNDALKTRIVSDVAKQRLLRGMAIRHAQIGAQFKEMVIDPIREYEAEKAAAANGGGTAEDVARLGRLRVAAEVAQDKLRVFGAVADKNLGMRLALMNRKERTKYWAEVRHAKGDRKRKHLRNAKRKATRARR
jgi:hypothetical protein